MSMPAPAKLLHFYMGNCGALIMSGLSVIEPNLKSVDRRKQDAGNIQRDIPMSQYCHLLHIQVNREVFVLWQTIVPAHKLTG